MSACTEHPDWKVGDWWTVDCAVYIPYFKKENASPIISGNILAPVKAWLVDWGHEEVHEEIKNFSELYAQTLTGKS